MIMKTIKTIGLLFWSILIWLILLSPRILIIFLTMVETIIKIIKSTLTHLIKTTMNEVLK